MRVKNRRGDFTPLLREPVAMRPRYFPDDPMGAKESKLPGHTSRGATSLFRPVATAVKEVGDKIAIAKTA